MNAPGLEHYLAQKWQQWQVRGASNVAEPLVFREGWSLKLCWRAKLSAWIIFTMFSGGFVGVFLLQKFDPMPPREFWFLVIGYSVFASFATYYLLFAHCYRVTVDETGIELKRFLIPTRRLDWSEITVVQYNHGDETLKLTTPDGKKLGLYLALIGLSAVRRCLAAFVPRCPAFVTSFATSDKMMLEDVPSWRCSDKDLEDNPLSPLSPGDEML